MASEKGHLEVVKLLVDRGGDPNAKNIVSTLFTTTYDLICVLF
jgi:ankyrin repeat protein